jgi:hypothetical protein
MLLQYVQLLVAQASPTFLRHGQLGALQFTAHAIWMYRQENKMGSEIIRDERLWTLCSKRKIFSKIIAWQPHMRRHHYLQPKQLILYMNPI